MIRFQSRKPLISMVPAIMIILDIARLAPSISSTRCFIFIFKMVFYGNRRCYGYSRTVLSTKIAVGPWKKKVSVFKLLWFIMFVMGVIYTTIMQWLCFWLLCCLANIASHDSS